MVIAESSGSADNSALWGLLLRRWLRLVRRAQMVAQSCEELLVTRRAHRGASGGDACSSDSAEAAVDSKGPEHGGDVNVRSHGSTGSQEGRSG